MGLDLKNRLKNIWQNIKKFVKGMSDPYKIKWFLISFPLFIVGGLIMLFVALNRSSFNVDIATILFLIGAIISAVSFSVWRVKATEVPNEIIKKVGE